MNQNYLAWEVREADFPSEGSIVDQLRFLVGYGLLAPSTHNTQPWNIQLGSGNEMRIAPDWDRALPFSDPSGRGMFISLGCCAFNVIVAAEHFGFEVDCEMKEGETRSAYVLLRFRRRTDSPGSSSGLGRLLPGISRRQSHKLLFKEDPVADQTIHELRLMKHGDAAVTVTTDARSKNRIASLHRLSTMTFSKNRGFSREVSLWMRPSGTTRNDGMPGFTFGVPSLPSHLIKFMTRVSPAVIRIVAKKDSEILTNAPAVGAVVTSSDTQQSWFDTGIAYQKVGLTLVEDGIYLAPKAAVIEAGNAQELSNIFESAGIPQLYFGLGYGDGVERHSPRRELDELSKILDR